MLIVTLSSNKLEGMAVTKLSTLTLLGAVLPYFVPAPYYFFLSFLPSFWTGMAIRKNALIYFFFSVLISGIWIAVLRKEYYEHENRPPVIRVFESRTDDRI